MYCNVISQSYTMSDHLRCPRLANTFASACFLPTWVFAQTRAPDAVTHVNV